MSEAPRDRHIPPLVSASEAAEMLGISRQAVQLMANNGQLLGAKVANVWVFRRVVVERAAAQRSTPVSRATKALTVTPPPQQRRVTQPPVDRVPYSERKPYIVADSLDDLTGPTTGVITLPHRVDWSGSPDKDLDIPGMLASIYQTILNEARHVEDLNALLNRDKLIELWPTLWLPARLRRMWQERFPELPDQTP